jgi:hypothetical protein
LQSKICTHAEKRPAFNYLAVLHGRLDIFSISHHEHRSGIEPLTGSARSVPIAPFRFAARG